MFFNNFYLVFMQKHYMYKNINKKRAFLIELPYNKITEQTKKLNIRPVIANIALKKYLIYYLDIISAIRIKISYCSTV